MAKKIDKKYFNSRSLENAMNASQAFLFVFDHFVGLALKGITNAKFSDLCLSKGKKKIFEKIWLLPYYKRIVEWLENFAFSLTLWRQFSLRKLK